jgi:2-polyprenyl-3-methyl-5-hydroxy-6-metoxy-1,4-benzoquinol methylase
LLRPAWRGVEAFRSWRGRGLEHGVRIAPDGLPLPPTRLIVLVAGTPEPEWFLESGALAARSIRSALGKAGAELERMGAILDFGCGCGRVLRQWVHLDGPEVWGTDYNERLVEWCRESLPFAHVSENALEPPLQLEAEQFDLVYGLSVFTHLPERLQHAWMEELRRVVRPGGFILFTAHGRRYLERLHEEERQRFLAGELVVRWERVAGTNLCAAYHPQSWVQERLAADALELVEFVPEGARGNPHQDLYLLRKPALPGM